MKKLVMAVLALSVCVSAGLAAQDRRTDEAAVRAVVDKFSPMWLAPNGVDVLRGMASPTHFVYFAENIALDTEGFSNLIQQMRKANPVVSYTHTVRKITFSGSLAFEYGLLEMTTKNGAMRTDVLNVFFREGSDWKLITSLPAAGLKDVLGM